MGRWEIFPVAYPNFEIPKYEARMKSNNQFSIYDVPMDYQHGLVKL